MQKHRATDDETSAAVTILDDSFEPYDPRRYGASHNTDKSVAGGTDNSAAFAAAASVGPRTIPVLFTGQVGDVTLTNPINGFNEGHILALEGSTAVFNLVRDTSGWGDWNHLVFENLFLDLLGEDAGGSDARTIHGFSYPEVPSSTEKTLAGRNVWRSVVISRADIAIYQPTGNFGNFLFHCQLSNGNYGIWGQDSETPYIMHPGEWHIFGGEISGNRKAAIYLSCNTESGNGLMFEGVNIEGNVAHGIYLDGWNLATDGPTLQNVHFENNNSGGVAIDLGFGRGSETPRDLMCHDVDHIQINKTRITSVGMEFNNSMADLDACSGNSSSVLVRSADSVVRMKNANLDGCSYLMDCVIDSLTQQRRPSGPSGVSMRAQSPPRDHIIYKLPGSGVSIYSETFADDAITMSSMTGVLTAGGGNCGLYKYHNRFATAVVDTTYTSDLLAIVQNKWYCWTLDFWLEGAGSDLNNLWFQNSATYLAAGLEQVVEQNVGDQWCTLGGVCEHDQASGNIRFAIKTAVGSAPVWNIGPVQLIQFDTQQEAIDYYNNRAFYQEKVYEASGIATLSGGTFALDFTTEGFIDQPDTNYSIQLTASDATNVYYDTKATTGFNINGSATATVNWRVYRHDL